MKHHQSELSRLLGLSWTPLNSSNGSRKTSADPAQIAALRDHLGALRAKKRRLELIEAELAIETKRAIDFQREIDAEISFLEDIAEHLNSQIRGTP